MNMNEFQFRDFLRQFHFALASLLWIPIPEPTDLEPQDVNRSLLWHPLVGFSIGISLAFVQLLVSPLSPTVAAVVVLIIWVVLTGGLNLEQLSASVEEWMHLFRRSVEPENQISDKSIATIFIVALLITKFAAFSAIFESEKFSAVIVACVASRICISMLLLNMGYGEPRNYGGLKEIDVDKTHMYFGFAISALLCVVISGLLVLLVITVCAVVVYLIQLELNRRSDSLSGNSCRTLVEVFEAVTLCVLAV